MGETRDYIENNIHEFPEVIKERILQNLESIIAFSDAEQLRRLILKGVSNHVDKMQDEDKITYLHELIEIMEEEGL